MLDLLKIKGFLPIIIVNGTLFGGFQIRNLAIAWLVLDITDSPLLVGLVNSSVAFAVLFLSPLGGAIADLRDRKKTALESRMLVAIVACVTSLIVILDIYEIWHFVILGILLGGFLAYGNAAFQALIFDLVGVNNFTRANSINTLITSISNTTAPLLAGLIIVSFSIRGVFLLFAIIYLIGWFLMYFVPSIETHNHQKENSSQRRFMTPLNEMLEGLKYSFLTPGVRWLIIFSMAVIFWGALQPVIPAYTRDVLGMGGEGYAYMLGVGGIGSLIVAVFLSIVGEIPKKSLVLTIAVIVYCIGVFIFATTTSIYIAYLGMFISGCTTALWMVIIFTLVQTSVDEKMRGRVVGVSQASLQLLGLGYLIGGIIAEFLGLTLALVIPAICWASLHIYGYLSSKEFRSY